MAQQQSSSGFITGAITVLGLGLVWVTVAGNFPSQVELSSAALPVETRHAAQPSSSLSSPPTLDLTIPTTPPLPSEAAVSRPDDDRSRDSNVEAPVVTRMDSSAPQATRLKCESDIEQLCPDSPEGSTRNRCLQQRAKQLSLLCQNQLYERFVKWKEGQSRVMAACEGDINRFCRAVTPGSGQILQCLQSHGQEVSDRCYQTFPKGTFLFK
jgi:Cysteine rich repeat